MTTQLKVPNDLKGEYPFNPHFHMVEKESLHYIDEGAGEPLVMLHGNPTWSFFYRNLAKYFSQHNYRVVIPDHIGCGLSSKPQD